MATPIHEQHKRTHTTKAAESNLRTMRSTHSKYHYCKPPQADADPSRHTVPSRHFMPLQSKYEETDPKIRRHEAQTHVKNRYKSEFIISDQKRFQTHATLEASPISGMRESRTHRGSGNYRSTEPSLTKQTCINGGTIQQIKT